jgi:hypothetical protein
MPLEEFLDGHIQNSENFFGSTQKSKERWLLAGWWAKFICITCTVIIFFTFISMLLNWVSVIRSIKFIPAGLVFLIISIHVCSCFGSYFIWFFGKNIRSGIQTGEVVKFNKGILYLKSFFISLFVVLLLTILLEIYFKVLH